MSEKAKKAGHKCPKCGTRHQSVRQYVNRNKPIVAPAPDWLPDADENVMAPDQVKATSGNPHVTPGRGSLVAERLSGPLTDGRQAPAVDDHCVGTGRSAELAWQHPSMRMATTNPVPLFSARTEADMFPRDLNGMSNGIPVALSRLDAYGAAGAPDFRQQPTGNPAMRRMPHIAPISALPANGGHSLATPARPPTGAMKASDRVEAVRQAMYGNRAR